MDINRNNYEQYFLDYLENRLSVEQQEILHRFLKFNPDLAEEINKFEPQTFFPEKIPFLQKDLLKKTIPGRKDVFKPENFDIFCIAFLEGDLTLAQRTAFKSYIDKHPEKAKQLDIFRYTQLTPSSVTYFAKAKLKRRNVRGLITKYVIPFSLAASLLLLLFINSPSPEEQLNQMAISEIPDKADNNLNENDEKAAKESQSVILQQAIAIKVIKNKKTPVPVSNYTNSENTKVENENEEIKDELISENQIIAIVNLKGKNISEMPVQYDRIIFQPTAPISISNSSLSAEAFAKKQILKVNNIIENEDEFLYSLASNGIKEINKLAGTNAELLASKDENGSITGIHFKSRILQVTTPISQDSD